MKFRPATFNDISQLQQLIALSARALSVGYYRDAQTESAIKYVFGVDTQLITDGTYYVAEQDGEFIGCGGWSKRSTLYGGDQHKGNTDNLLDPATDAAKIRAFFIHPAHARKGLATDLITVCENAAKQNGFTRAELGATLPGVPFYITRGYKEIEFTNIILPDGEAFAIVKMGKML